MRLAAFEAEGGVATIFAAPVRVGTGFCSVEAMGEEITGGRAKAPGARTRSPYIGHGSSEWGDVRALVGRLEAPAARDRAPLRGRFLQGGLDPRTLVGVRRRRRRDRARPPTGGAHHTGHRGSDRGPGRARAVLLHLPGRGQGAPAGKRRHRRPERHPSCARRARRLCRVGAAGPDRRHATTAPDRDGRGDLRGLCSSVARGRVLRHGVFAPAGRGDHSGVLTRTSQMPIGPRRSTWIRASILQVAPAVFELRRYAAGRRRSRRDSVRRRGERACGHPPSRRSSPTWVGPGAPRHGPSPRRARRVDDDGSELDEVPLDTRQFGP